MSLSDAVENEMLTDFLTRHPTLKLALSTTNPGEDGSGITEPVGGNYARADIGDITLSGSSISNDDPIMFPQSGSDWSTLTHVGVFDSSGNFCGSAAVTPTACPAGTIIVVAAETDIITIT